MSLVFTDIQRNPEDGTWRNRLCMKKTKRLAFIRKNQGAIISSKDA